MPRLVLWNVDHTLVDVGRVTREAYAEAFERVTGRPLVRLAPTAGRTESEIIFETLAFNDIETTERHLPEFMTALGEAFGRRGKAIREYGRVLPGAAEALFAVARLPDLVQSVLTGSIEPNTIVKLTALGLDEYLDLDVGGYGSATYPKAATVELARTRAGKKYGAAIEDAATVLVADSPNDVRAARISRAKIIAVATGTATQAELRGAGADTVLPTLAETDQVVRAIDALTCP